MVYLRKNIIECAWGVSRTKDCFFSHFSYHQTQIRKKNKMKVLVAVARKLLIAIWHVPHDATDYKDFGADNDYDTSVSESNGCLNIPPMARLLPLWWTTPRLQIK